MSPLVRHDYRPPKAAAAASASASGTLTAPFTRHDVLYLTSSELANQVVGAVSGWIDCDNADSAAVRAESAAQLRAELAWAGHLGLQAVLLPPPKDPKRVANYAHVINQVCVRSLCCRRQGPVGGRVGEQSADGR